MSSELGEWEKHTKGIGAKLLFKMGYQPGKGLGKNLQGRCEPVEAQVRKGRGAVGMYGPENMDSPGGKEILNIPEKSSLKEKGKNCHSVKNINGPTADKTLNQPTELYRAKKQCDVTNQKQPLIRHTVLRDESKGKQCKYQHELIGSLKNQYQFEELFFNLDCLVDSCKHDIVKNKEKLDFKQNQMMDMLEAQMKNINLEVSKETNHISILKSLLDVLTKIEEKHSKNALSLEFLLKHTRILKQSYPEEYESFDLANVLLNYLIPLTETFVFTKLRPIDFKSTDRVCLLLFKQLRHMLEFNNELEVFVHRYQHLTLQTASANSKRGAEFSWIDPYHRLLLHAWLPTTQALVNQWNCRNAEPMIYFLDTWNPVLPNWIMEYILYQLILPKIQIEVDYWNPSTDLPINVWIHPWIPRLELKLDVVYHKIRDKMTQALVAWTPRDQYARTLLFPWIDVFSANAMNGFLRKNIFPKLQDAIVKWDINPFEQKLDVWHWIMDWKDVASVESLVHLLVNFFFPKWMKALVAWLNNNPNYNEIAEWYMGWKTLFPLEFVHNSEIKGQFIRALSLMNRSLPVEHQVDCTPSFFIKIPVPADPQLSIAETIIPQGFRELIEYRCAQQGILCVPLANRFHAGRPIFRVGKVLCYFEKQVIFVLANGVWNPKRAQQLLDMAKLEG